MRAACLAFLLVLAAAPGCTCRGVNRGDVNLLSLDDEWALGEQLAAEVDAQTEPLADSAAQAFLGAMGAALAAETELAGRPWTFTVLAEPTVNAFAVPGGHVYVHAGTIAAARSQAELASVVAHEVAHGVARHGTERMVKAHGLALVAGLLLGEDPGLLQQVVAEVVGRSAIARFSRDDEREADALGVEALAAAGYDPDGMAAMVATMTALRARQPGPLERWFATHPLGEERVAAATAAAREAEPAGPPPTAPAVFESVRQRVRATVGSSVAAR